jgi:hypothetical protein
MKLQEGCRFEECVPSLELESGNKGFAGLINQAISQGLYKEPIILVL